MDAPARDAYLAFLCDLSVTLDEALRTAAEQAGAVVLPRVEGDERRGVG